jgi:uncharacterized repeat protein (TIGR02543 family)
MIKHKELHNVLHNKLLSLFIVFSLMIINMPVNILAKTDSDLNVLGLSNNMRSSRISPALLNERWDKKTSLTRKERKINGQLLQLVNTNLLPAGKSKAKIAEDLKMSGQLKTNNKIISNGTEIQQDAVYVYITLSDDGDFADLTRMGINIKNEDQRNHLAAAWMDIEQVSLLSEMDTVRSIELVEKPNVMVGSVETEGDNVLQVDLARSLSGISGLGVKVGIISDGVDSASAAILLGDLPGDLNILSNLQGGNEGTAMLEIVHDLAPDASLFFHDCGSNVLEFNSAIDDLVSAGCTVICDDISWTSEPYFEDGIIAQHIQQLIIENQITYVTSAGNFAKSHYQGQFYDDGSGYGYHDFSNGTEPVNKYIYVKIPAGAAVAVSLQWDESFGSATSDYDLYLYNWTNFDLLACSETSQAETLNPDEYLTYINNSGTTIIAEVDVKVFDAPDPKMLELYIWNMNGVSIYPNNLTPSDSIFGQAAVTGVITCGAVDVHALTQIEQFSSQGPVTMLTNVRQKPDITGVDGVAVTGAGGFYTPFYGTSASAPHIAAIAALLYAAYPKLTPDMVRQKIENTAVDLGNPGYDDIFGYGRIDALAAIGPIYQVFFDKNNGDSDPYPTYRTTVYNGIVNLPSENPTKGGYTFKGWNTQPDGSGIEFTSLTEVNENMTVYAQYLINCYTISYDSQGGTVIASPVANFGATIAEPAIPVKTGYTFAGWYKEAACVNAWNFSTDMVTTNITLFAKWTINSYTVIFNSQGGTAVASRTAVYNTLITAPAAPTCVGYLFVGWYTSLGYTTPWNFATNKILGPTTIYARWLKSSIAVLAAQSTSYSSIQLSWTATTGANYYEIYRATSSAGTYTLIQTQVIPAVTFANIGLTTGKTYYYKVRAYAVIGATKIYSGYSAVASVKPVPATPTSLKAASAGYSSIKLTWAAVAGASGYAIYRATSLTGTYSYVVSTTALSYTNTGRTAGRTYYYKIKAYRIVGTTRVYGNLTAVVSAKPIPATSATFTVARYSSTSVKVSWSAVSGASGYEIYRATTLTGTYSLLKRTTLRYYTNTGLTTGSTYFYKVRTYRYVGSTRIYGEFTSIKSAAP